MGPGRFARGSARGWLASAQPWSASRPRPHQGGRGGVATSVAGGVAVLVAGLLAGCAGPGDVASRAVDPALAVARAALAAGNPGIAAHAAQDALVRAPGDPAALTIAGEALVALGHPAQAAARLRQAIARDPEGRDRRALDARMALGRLELHAEPQAAAAQFRAVLAADPRDADAANDLGISRDLRGKHRAAQAAYRVALAARPELRAAQVNLALSLALSGEGARAVALLRPLAGPEATPRVRQDLAAATAMAGHPGAAAALLADALPPDQARDAAAAYAALGAPAPARPPGG